MSVDSTSKTQHRRPDLDSLYCINDDGSRNVIHTADVKGRYQTRKKIVWTVLIGLWVVLPWIRVGGHPAILIDLPNRNFYLFGQTFNAQDFYLAYFLLTGLGFSLFVISALFGRIWCGYACPHTVFLDGVFRRIERWTDGTAAQRKKLAEMGWNAQKIGRRALKYTLFAALSLFLSHNFLSYFMGADVVLAAITGSPAEHSTAFGFVVVFTLIIFGNFAWFREQLCIVICPYGRLQGVLYDEDTVNVAYDGRRGEPRGKYQHTDRGDCIDCFRCVAVCPTGIDIRNGTQLECVGCANCIDACDEVMAKVGHEPGLIRYDSKRGIETGVRRFIRPRLFLYGFFLLLGTIVFAVAAFRRTPFEAKLMRQHAAPFQVTDGVIRNPLQLRILNKQPKTLRFVIEPVEQPGVRVLMSSATLELESLADERLGLVVEIQQAAWHHGMEIEMVVRTEDGTLQERITAPLSGPR